MTVYVKNLHVESKAMISDPSFSLEYARLYEEKEEGEAVSYLFENEHGKVEHVFLKRKTPYLIDGKQYYDITTPYGYGGPVILEAQNRDELIKDYYEAFHDYCLEQSIISEFIRFHLFKNNLMRKNFNGETTAIGPHVYRDLSQPLNTNMSKDIRHSLKKFKKLGLNIRYDTTGEKVEHFLSIYNKMLIRNHASSYYIYDKSFFEKMHETMNGKFVYVSAEMDGQIVASRLAVYGEQYGFGLLGGTLKEYYHTNATAVVDYHILKYLSEKGCRYFALGGGLKDKDGIYRYKKKFNKEADINFYVGKKIHDEIIYNKSTIIHQSKKHFDSTSSFFPLYRA